ncbi:MAG: ABC-2 family transporter protein, partial [Devosia sp.]
AFVTTSFQAHLAYRGQVWTSVFGNLVQVFANIAIWMSIYAGVSVASGVSIDEMIAYAIFGALLLSAWDWRRFIRVVGDQVRTGDVAVFLLKPLSYPLMLLAAECGNVGFRLIAIIAPVSIAAALVYGMSPPASVFHGAMSLLFVVLAFAILFLLATVAALTAFWVMTVFAVEWLLHAFVLILSGAVVPLWFYPPAAAAIIEKLPFAFTAYHPRAVYLGKEDVATTLVNAAVGCLWVLVLTLLLAWLWSRARQRIIVQGG